MHYPDRTPSNVDKKSMFGFSILATKGYKSPKDLEIFKTKRVYQMSLNVIILTHSWYIFSFIFGIFIESVIANILFTAGLLRVTRNDLFTMAYQNSARTAKLNHETD